MRGKVFWVVTVVFLVILTLPYLLAWAAAGSDWVFVGFLINPLDGNSYFAKMQQGAAGEWLFRLPFTAEPGEGSFLFIFYLIFSVTILNTASIIATIQNRVTIFGSG